MAINVPASHKEDAWDKVAKALSIANQGVNLVAGVHSVVKGFQPSPEEQRIKQGILTPKEQVEYGAKYSVSDSPAPGAIPLKTENPDGSLKTVYYAPKKDTAVDTSGLMTPSQFMELKNKQFSEVPAGTKGADTVYVPGPDGKPVAHAMMPPKFQDPAKEPKSDQFKVAQFGQRMQQSEDVFKKLGEEGFDPTSAGSGAQRTSILGLGLPNNLKSAQVQQQEQAERSFVNAVLRRESGAAISKDEFTSAEKQYFPRYGDSPEVLKQKAENRALAINGFKQEAGGAWNKVGQGVAAPTMIAAKQGKPSELFSNATADQQKPPKGQVKVSNGKETYFIPAKRFPEAAKDGFKVIE